MIRRVSSISGGKTSVSLLPRNPVLNGRRRSRERRAKCGCCRRLVLTLLGLVVLFSMLDVFELVVVSKHHKLSELRPALQRQKEKVVEVLKEEKEELKREISNLWHKRGRPSEEALDEEEEKDKEPIYEILEQAGVSRYMIDIETRRKLPTWTKIEQLYGKEPKIYGLERCEDFTSRIEPSVSFFGIAGTFNSGTNLLAELLIQNCQITKRMEVFGEDQRGMRWQVPWGKHTPVEYREEHVTPTDKDVPLENSFPMITIRDPYRWMRSMCKHIYGARWPHNLTACPHIYMDDYNRPSPVRVKYKTTVVHHDSLPAMWNDWYNHYFEQSFPRVFVRFEDLIFFGKNVTQTLCKCGGGVPRRPTFVHVKSSAKLGTAAHGANKTGLLDALIQFGSDEGRITGMTETDLKWARKLLDPRLMEMFAYRYA
jgi:hypothetical protein